MESQAQQAQTELKPEWGLSPQKGVEALAAWGGRLIYEYQTIPSQKRTKKSRGGDVRVASISILGDRQGFAGECKEARDALCALLRKHWGDLDKAMIRLDSEGVISRTSEGTVVVMDTPDFQFYVNPRGSYGYLYAGAYLKKLG